MSDLLPEEKKRKDYTVCELLKGAQSEEYSQIKRCYILLGKILEKLCEKTLAEILGNKFDSKASYYAELRAECSSHTAAQLGCVYQKDGGWISAYFNVFNHSLCAYPLFMEALNIVTYNKTNSSE